MSRVPEFDCGSPACALAIRDRAGSAAAPAASCKKFRRRSFTPTLPRAVAGGRLTGLHHRFESFESQLMAHRDGRRLDDQPSLSWHCGHGPIFVVQRSVTNDPYVWSGRASQEVSSIWRLCGLASMYPASDWSGFVLRAIMDISARAF